MILADRNPSRICPTSRLSRVKNLLAHDGHITAVTANASHLPETARLEKPDNAGIILMGPMTNVAKML